MEQKDLTGKRFTDSTGISFVVLAGYEGKEIVFDETSGESPLGFCCDSVIKDGKLHCSYRATYTVTKKEFFAVIEKSNIKYAETIVSELKNTYYKIPTVFLELVAQTYLKERK